MADSTNDERVEFFSMIPDSSLLKRLSVQCQDEFRDFRSAPLVYIRRAIFPDRFTRSLFALLFARVFESALELIKNPITFLGGLLAADRIGRARRVRFLATLAMSVMVHGGLIAYLFYTGVISPFTGIRLVSRPYEQYRGTILQPLVYPPGMLRGPVLPGESLTLDEIVERERRRRERENDREAEAEKNEANEETKEEPEVAKTDDTEDAAEPGPMQIGEINEAPIRDIIGKVYEQYQAGQMDLEGEKFTIMAVFKIEPDGSLSNIEIVESSGSKVIDSQGEAILWAIGESRALGSLSTLSSNSIKFELTESIARLTITGFAPSAAQARIISETLRVVVKGALMFEKNKRPEVAELLSLIKLTSDNQRIDAELMVSRERAAQMMNERFGPALSNGKP